jgi:DNA-binding NarL/FixJ family response regulator
MPQMGAFSATLIKPSPLTAGLLAYLATLIRRHRRVSVFMSSSSVAIRILTVDDHPVLRSGIGSLIGNHSDMHIVGEAGSGEEAIGLYRRLLPDVTLMDLQMPDMDGVECIKRIRQEFPLARFLVLTTYAGDVLAHRALKAGAHAYVLKQAARTELVDHIRAVFHGLRRVQAEVATNIANHTGDELLSAREIQVLGLVARGNANKQVAKELFINDETVKGHMKSILAKLHASDRTHAVTEAIRRGIIQL